jgi:hypothetical protein
MANNTRLSEPAELTDAELESVAAGVALFGLVAQTAIPIIRGQGYGAALAGGLYGERIQESVSTFGGQATGEAISHPVI